MASFEAIMKKFLEDYEKQSEDILVKEFMVRAGLVALRSRRGGEGGGGED